MWLSRKFGSDNGTSAENGTVAIGGSATLRASATVQSDRVQSYAPYGYCAFAPSGEDILLISSADGTAGAGTRMKDETLSEGEISITSLSGGRILLKADGSVVINGFVFTADGVVKNPKGEIVL